MDEKVCASATPPPFVTVAEASPESPVVLPFPHNVFDPLSMPFFMPPSQPVSKNLSQTVSMKERMKLFREQKGIKEDQAVSAKDMEEFLAAVDTTSSSSPPSPTAHSSPSSPAKESASSPSSSLLTL